MTDLSGAVSARIRRHGPLSFESVVDMALYDPEAGFYVAGGRAGRQGDFLTSPEVGPLFGEIVARALDDWWRTMGEPSTFVVVEVGAGPGTLARSVLRAHPACSSALRYVLVETSAAQRALHAEHLPLEDPAAGFAVPPAPDDDDRTADPPPGPIVVSLAELPRVAGPCIVLANELLDNLPFGIAARVPDGWAELHVTETAGRLAELVLPLGAADASRLDQLVPDAPVGARVPLPRRAARWVQEARHLAGQGGRLVVLDYADTTASLATRPWLDWVRTYRGHARGGHPLVGLGTQDITCEVAIDQLGAAPSAVASQADWLRGHGLEELVADGRRTWHERAAIGDLAAIRARSRVTEAAALVDPAGLGAFRVLEWT